MENPTESEVAIDRRDESHLGEEENGGQQIEDVEVEEEDKCISFQSFVKEAEAILSWVRDWVEKKRPAHELQSLLIKTLQKYQEFPQLLDPHLEAIIAPLMQLAREEIANASAIHPIFSVVYVATKVRGYKTIIRFFPHEVMDLEPTLQLLEKQDPRDHETWETRYILLLWMSILALVPFDLSTIDALVHGDSAVEGQKTLIERVIDQCKLYMHEAGPIHQAAGILVSRLLTRTDMHKTHLNGFLNWCKTLLLNLDNSVFVITGTLSTLSHIFKNGQRQDLLQAIPIIYEPIMSLLLYDRWRGNALFNKLIMKVIQRMGLTFLKPRIALWRYQRGNQSLLRNLKGNQPTSAVKHGEMDASQDDEEDFDLPEDGELEAILDALLQGLRDKDTIVRWSVAKGIGRITNRLPQEFADQVVGTVLELFNAIEGDTAWHGACLATAELARRGLLLPKRLEAVVPLVIQALLYDVRRGACSVGAYVRDAACYVCWAFARAYAPEVLAPFMPDLARTLILVTVFDREVNCRRAASAAFQENVGRQGTFPHGIEILTQADYFAVGNRFDAYTKVAIFVSQFEDYRRCLIDHLLEVKIKNWDKNLRSLAAHTLGLLTKSEPAYMHDYALPLLFPQTISEDLFERHGAVLAIADILLGLKSVSYEIAADHQTKIRNVVVNIEKARLYRGRGGEIMRGAACRLIECLSKTSMNLPSKTVLRLQQSLEETLKHPTPEIQVYAVDGIKAFSAEYYEKLSETDLDELVNRFLKCAREDENPASRRGYALALGVLPFTVVRKYDTAIIKTLVEGMQIEEDAEKRDVETRRNSAISLHQVFTTLSSRHGELYDITQHRQIFYDTFVAGLGDYCTDNRGDVGSWVREVCMKALETFAKTMVSIQSESELVTSEMCARMMTLIAKQAVEKIDRVRETAGLVYHSLVVSAEPKIPHIPRQSELEQLISRYSISNWSSPTETYPMFVELLKYDEYRYEVLAGYVISVGGLTESIVKSSGESFKKLLQESGAQPTSSGKLLVHEITLSILQLFQENVKKERVIIPLLKTLDFMLSNDLFSELVSNPLPVAGDEPTLERQLYISVRDEIKGSRDIPKLMVAANVVSGLLVFPSIRTNCLQQLFILLCHKFPKIRKHAADQLYLRLLTLEECVPEESFEDILMILSSTSWLEPVPVVRPERDKLFGLTGVPKPAVVTKTGASSSGRSTTDDGYQDLVKEMGF